MMKNFLMTTVVCAGLLGGCTTTGPLTQEQINVLIAQIQTYTAQACAFQPTAASVASLIAAMVPSAALGVSIVNVIGEAICKAPTTKAVVRRGAVVTTKIVSTPQGPIVIQGRRL